MGKHGKHVRAGDVGTDTRRHLVIIGGGFGGMSLLRKLDPRQWRVTLVDRNNYHSFPPLFYQVASSGLEPSGISFPLRRELRKLRRHGWRYHLGDVSTIDVERKVVTTQYEHLAYDALVVAAGTTNNFFNMPELAREVYTIKSTGEAIECRNEILDRLERASVAKDPDYRRRLLSFVVVGGGPTGVEIAGALGEMKRYVVPREYPLIAQDEVQITLVEGSHRLLGAMRPDAGEKAEQYLESLMVHVALEKTMLSYRKGVVNYSDGSSQPAGMLIWTAGVTAEAFDVLGAPDGWAPGHGGRWPVDEYNQVVGLAPDVYAIGDVCISDSDPDWPQGCPQLAQVAIQQGRTLARNLNRGQMRHPFRYHDKGTMATVGRNRAVVEMGRLHYAGFLAWFTWMFVHLVSLMGMRNRLTVLINWIWAYFSYSSSLRLLFRAACRGDTQRK